MSASRTEHVASSTRPAPDALGVAIALGVAPPVVLWWLALAGLATMHHEDGSTAALVACIGAAGPALYGALMAPGHRRLRHGALAAGLVAVTALIVLPVLVPGERADAIAAGVGFVLGDVDPEGAVAEAVRASIPAEPAPVVAPVTAEPVAAAPPILPDDHEIVLPYEGEGRQLTVPVVFEHRGRTREVVMMLDTGATYTTLPSDVLVFLGAYPGADAPELTLTTANGKRTARVGLIDEVWLGDLAVPGVAVTLCEDCAGDEAAGLLGLNVAGGFNVTIDADRREVVFRRRARFDRRLDVRPFVDLTGRFTRFPGGRVEVILGLANTAPRRVDTVAVHIACGADQWRVALGPVPPGEHAEVTRRLPRHDRCEPYSLSLDQASW